MKGGRDNDLLDFIQLRGPHGKGMFGSVIEKI